MNINYFELDRDQIDELKSLWENLRDMHADKSKHFERNFRELNFEIRKSKVLKAEKVNLLMVKDDDKSIGYCISTINDNNGSVESLYLEKSYRKYGIGNKLVKKSIDWIKSNNPESISVTVAAGNEEVIDFYRRFGFEICLLDLKMTERMDL